MFYVYVLRSKKNNIHYTGFTKNLWKRIEEHNRGEVKSTKGILPLELIYYEACIDKMDAIRREKYLKTTYGKRYLKNRLMNYYKDRN